jgi:hypothetical protein
MRLENFVTDNKIKNNKGNEVTGNILGTIK